MELSFLHEKATAEKRYKHFTVNATPSVTENTYGKSEFFYIGRNTSNIDNLIRCFESGYAAENVEKGISILKKIIEKRCSYPDAIFIDASVGIVSLTSLHTFLSSSKFLVSIPLIIDVSGSAEKVMADLRSLNFIDEIISLDSFDYDKLHSKIHLLKRIKDIHNQHQLQEKISESQSFSQTVSLLLKRCFDIVLSSVMLIFLSPLFGLIAIAIKLESRGPIFYVAKRAGRGYRIFHFIQFRTMECGADKKIEQLSHLNQYTAHPQDRPVFFKVSNDPRITRIGAFLRNYSLDELPQLVNIMLGDMSLVGNRPLPLYEAATLTTDEWAERFMAPAGITGLWQIKKRGQEDMSVEERICLDIAYANRNNFIYDLWIMANTPTAIVQKSNV